MTDGFLPFRNYTPNVIEKEGKDVKEDLAEPKGLMKEGLNKVFGFSNMFDKKTNQAFELDSFAFCKSLNLYVKLKKYDSSSKTYKCR